MIGDYNHQCWNNYISGLEGEKEGGERCKKMFYVQAAKNSL